MVSPKDEAREALSGAKEFADEIAAKLAGSDPEVTRKIVEFLSEQNQLLKVQNEQLKGDETLRRVGSWVRIVVQLILAIAVAFIVVGVFVLARGAVTSRSVTIDPFEAPPA